MGEYLSHRIVDVSTVRGLYRRWVGEPRPQGKAHRAILDCEEAIAELRFYRGRVFALAPRVAAA